MSYSSMAKQLLGDVPGTNLPQVQSMLNQSLLTIYDEQRWSFQVKEDGWLSPGLLGGLSPDLTYDTPGRMTVKPYSNTVYGDAVSTAIWGGMVGRPFITEMQFRVPAYSLYNIIRYYAPGDNPEDPNTPFATLILERPWMEPAQTDAVYMIYQAYFPVPSPTFRRFGTIRDTTNDAWVNYWQRDQAWLATNDPQRTVFDQPTYAVPYEVDYREGSATYGHMLYELWPHPLSILPYTFTYQHAGPLMKKPTDHPPYPINEELLMWRAKEMAFLWKESQKGDGMERGSGANWQYLAQAAHAQYTKKLRDAAILDRNLGDLYWTKFTQTPVSNDGYETMVGTLNVGTF